jgi:hypothetical protein
MKTESNTENKILDYLMNGNSLTVLDCQRLFSTSELRTYISRIIKRGYNVVSSRVRVVCGDGHTACVKRFKIAKSF